MTTSMRFAGFLAAPARQLSACCSATLLRSVEEFGDRWSRTRGEEDHLMEMWSLFRGQLDQHQQVEDGVYFPVITSMNPDFASCVRHCWPRTTGRSTIAWTPSRTPTTAPG